VKNLDPALVIALLGAGGLGAFFKDIFEGLWKLRSGVSARETKRRIDVVQQLDEAYTRLEAERERAERAERNVSVLREYATDLRIQLRTAGVARNEIQEQPELERTMDRNEVRRIIDKENS
jgi:hypothetical protein